MHIVCVWAERSAHGQRTRRRNRPMSMVMARARLKKAIDAAPEFGGYLECGKAHELPSSDSRLNPVAVPAHKLYGFRCLDLLNGSDSKTICDRRTVSTVVLRLRGQRSRSGISYARSLNLRSVNWDTACPVSCSGCCVRKQPPRAKFSGMNPFFPLFLKRGERGVCPYETRRSYRNRE